MWGYTRVNGKAREALLYSISSITITITTGGSVEIFYEISTQSYALEDGLTSGGNIFVKTWCKGICMYSIKTKSLRETSAFGSLSANVGGVDDRGVTVVYSFNCLIVFRKIKINPYLNKFTGMQ